MDTYINKFIYYNDIKKIFIIGDNTFNIPNIEPLPNNVDLIIIQNRKMTNIFSNKDFINIIGTPPEYIINIDNSQSIQNYNLDHSYTVDNSTINIYKNNLSYDNINTLQLSEDRYLFLDIFATNNILYLMCPVYEKKYTDELNNLKIYVNDTLYQFNILNTYSNKYESMLMIKVNNLNLAHNEIITVKISYFNSDYSYKLIHKLTRKKFKLAHTTLFKHDIYLFNLFYNFYTSQGTEFFYLCYNGIINDDIKSVVSKYQNVKLFEWNFHYFTENLSDISYDKVDRRHHTQQVCNNTIYYKYGIYTDYIIYCDLDEYLITGNLDIPLSKICDNNIDTIYFKHVFCRTFSDELKNLEKLPKKFLKSTKIYEFPERSKFIVKTNNTIILCIHYIVFFNQLKFLLDDKLQLLHFREMLEIFDDDTYITSRL
jgi:hypothetical protein